MQGKTTSPPSSPRWRKTGLTGVEEARSLDVAAAEIRVVAPETLEECVPLGRLDLAQLLRDRAQAFSRARLARSMFIVSSTGTGSVRKNWANVRTKILRSSQSDQWSRYQAS